MASLCFLALGFVDFAVLEVCGFSRFGGLWYFGGFVGFRDLGVCGILWVLAIFTGLMLYF